MDPLVFQRRSVAVYCLLIILISTQARLLKLCSAQLAGFLSIDCGSESSQAYNDSLAIEWTPDASLMQEGSTANLPPPTGNNDTRYKSIRYFEGNQTKYCYVLSGSGLVVEGNSYLVRLAFWLGVNLEVYATQGNDSTLLEFKVIVDAYEAAEISIPLPQSEPVVKEIYLQAQSNSIAVCLSGSVTGSDAPFISSLELRPLNDIKNPVYTMNTIQRALLVHTRVNYGTPDYYPAVRYPDDAFDRIWWSDSSQPSNSTEAMIANKVADIPPVLVLQTAYISNWTSGFYLDYNNSGQQYYYAFYFSEIDPRVNATGLRVFDIFIDDIKIYDALDVYSLSGNYGCYEAWGSITTTSDSFIVNFLPTSTVSTYPPFISAVEILELLQSPMSSGTFNGDVLALDGIKASLAKLSSYTGDPCLPQNYAYSWLNCTSVIPPRVTGILLSNYGLIGQIPTNINDLTHLTEIKLNDNHLNGPIPDLSALTSLEVLDLSNNKLSGPIPNSLATLSSLKYLYLKNNNLSGAIPPSLLTLEIDYSGNPFLCTKANGTCVSTTPIGKGKVNIGLIVGLIIGGLIISILVVLGIVYIHRRKQTPQVDQPPTTTDAIVVGHTQVLEASNVAQVFIYRDIEAATNNFSLKLGGGGFGSVYQGKLMNGRKVAMKVLSQVSQQGAKEFLNELGLLSRVHHKNLVGLLGYCIEENLVLVYEYLSKGSLFDCLHGRHAHYAPLSWRSRLHIMVDAASGLEYLHHGCNPQIIHRDVKSSNILLSEDMEAKIADFGISRLRRANFDKAIPTLMGSWGYLDPEYTSTLNLTEKVDVYSFGVLLFEILCGRRPITKKNPKEEAHIVEWVRPHIKRGAIDEIVDKSMEDDGYNVSAVWKVVEIALRCVEPRSMDRPDMGEICIELKDAMRFEIMGDHVAGSSEPSSLEYFPTNTSNVQVR